MALQLVVVVQNLSVLNMMGEDICHFFGEHKVALIIINEWTWFHPADHSRLLL